MAETAAYDFFVVPTVTFQRLFVLVVMSFDRRRILHVNVTRYPTAEWVAQQVREAFPGDGWAFRRTLKALGIQELVSAPRSPWQSTYVERVIGTFRLGCTDHIIPLSEGHLRRTMDDGFSRDRWPSGNPDLLLRRAQRRSPGKASAGVVFSTRT